MTFRRAVLSFVVLPWLLVLSAAQANMPGTSMFLASYQVKGGAALDCTGGTITTSGVTRIHTFNSSSSLVCTGSGTATYLVVAGGGSGSYGGGGAGGLLSGSTSLVSGTYSITVGSGGTGVTGSTLGNSGNNSVFNGNTALGGGGGGPPLNASPNGGNGGSGGGAGNTTGSVSGTGGTGTVGQGNNGGANTSGASAGGGGGCNAAGANASGTTGGNGGAGCASSISGSSVTYAGGGGGAASVTPGSGGATGGGAGGTGSGATSGTANTGGGGGGQFNSAGTSGAGGSGVVIVSYPSPRNPISLGTASAAGSASSIAVTGGVNIVAGDLVVVSIGHLTASGTTVTSVSDGTNTYTRATTGTDSTAQEAELWYKINASAVTNPTITANLSGSAANRVIGAVRVAGGLTTLNVAPAGAGFTASTSPTVSTGTLATSTAEIVIGFLYVATAPTVTEGSGFTQIYNENANTATNHLAFQVTTATTTVAYSPTLNVNSNSVIMVAAFR